jgi:glycerol uptake facilitator-like aquaporin
MMIKFLAEFFGTLFLVMIVLGSGVMAQNLFPGQVGLALLVNSLATGVGLYTLIQSLGTISHAHFNPVVSFVDFLCRRISKKDFGLFIMAQLIGAYLGVELVHLMFKLPIFVLSDIDRSGGHLLFSELIATFGLIGVILLSRKSQFNSTPICVATYIGAGYWFTASTAFTNPAVTFARLFTNTFGGMAPVHFLPFVVSQIMGALLAWFFLRKI